MKTIKILIADDHSVVRLGLSALLQYQKDLKVVGEADDGKSAADLAKELKPDVVIMDLMMPGMSGVDATKLILNASPETKVLILTSFGTSADVAKAVAAGASGAVMKGASNEELLGAIRSTACGEKVLSPEIEQNIMESPKPPEFTQRQLEILHSVTRGLSNPDIAKQFGISSDAVKQHLSAIYQKLGVATRTEAITIALRKQLLKV